MTRGGVSLLEVLLAVVVLEVGVLATTSLLTSAARTRTEAEILERMTALVAEVADSLAREGFAGPGTRRSDWGEVRWSVAGGGGPFTVRIEAVRLSGDRGLEAWTAVPARPSPRGAGLGLSR